MTNTIENRDAKIKDWLILNFWTNKTNLLLFMIILIAIAVRVFFFIQTISAGQTLWFDEAEYMSQGTHYLNNIPYEINPQRPPAFQYLIALALGLGLDEHWIIFLLSLLPSILIVILVFILGVSLFNNRVGLIASAFLAVSWNFIFWSNRAQPDFLSICCQVLAIYYFWEMLKKKSEYPESSAIKLAVLAGIWSAAGFYFKVSSLLIPLAFLIFILIKDKLKVFIIKEYWIYGFSYLVSFIPYLIWSYYIFNTPLGFVPGYSTTAVGDVPISWAPLAFFQIFGLNVMFFTFLVGGLLCLKALLYLDIIIKRNDLDKRIFILTLMITTLCFYIFYIRAVEDRWVLLLLPLMSILCGMFLGKIYDWISEYGNWKWIGVIMITSLLIWSSYEQFNQAKVIIDNKMESYKDVKFAAEWMQQNSQPNEIIMSQSYPQTIFYSQREVKPYTTMNITTFEAYINSNHPTYLTISIYEYHPIFIYDWIQNNSRIIPVNGYFQDIEKTKPSLIIYRFAY